MDILLEARFAAALAKSLRVQPNLVRALGLLGETASCQGVKRLATLAAFRLSESVSTPVGVLTLQQELSPWLLQLMRSHASPADLAAQLEAFSRRILKYHSPRTWSPEGLVVFFLLGALLGLGWYSFDGFNTMVDGQAFYKVLTLAHDNTYIMNFWYPSRIVNVFVFGVLALFGGSLTGMAFWRRRQEREISSQSAKFLLELAMNLSSGMPLLAALGQVQAAALTPQVRHWRLQVRDSLLSGQTLSEAFAAVPALRHYVLPVAGLGALPDRELGVELLRICEVMDPRQRGVSAWKVALVAAALILGLVFTLRPQLAMGLDLVSWVVLPGWLAGERMVIQIIAWVN